ncbi:MAG TPA: type II secretion system major pseudopilin GspG [bacterium]|nr:type II secretion system major pseudopilin GspG [bacterium]
MTIPGNARTAHGRYRRHSAGFTMMELLIVLVIISLLAALVGPMLYKRIKPAKRAVARAQIEHFMTALDTYFIETGGFPTTQQGLKALRVAPQGVKGWNGPYLTKEVPEDPWGDPYVYRNPGRSGGYEILSYGADGREGGSDDNQDITSWQSGK